MPSTFAPKTPVVLEQKNKSIEESFSFGGKPIKASRVYNNYPVGQFSYAFLDLPSQQIEAVSWSPNGRFISFACSNLIDPTTNSSLASYYYSGTGFGSKVSPGTYLPGAWPEEGVVAGANSYSVAWSPTGQKLAVGTNGAYKLNIYSFDEGIYQFTNMDQPIPPEYFSDTATCTGLSWSPDGTLLAASFNQDPYVYVFGVTETSIVLLTSLEQNYSIPASSCSWSPDGRYLCVGYFRPPYIGMYEFNGLTFKKLPDANSLPTARVNKVSWSPDGRVLAVAHSRYPTVSAYLFENKRLSRINVEHTRPALDDGDDTALDVAWSSDGRYVAASFSVLPSTYVYSYDGKKLTKIHHSQPPGVTGVCAWRPDGELLVTGSAYCTTSPGDIGPGPMLKIESPRNKPV